MPFSSGPNTVKNSITFDYDIGDTANSYKGEPTTNLTPYSQDFSSWFGNLFGNWINSDVTLNASIAPDGTLTGNRFGNGYSRYTNSIVASTSTVYTFSVWLKNVSLSGIGVQLYWSFGLNGGLVSYGNGLSVGIGTLTSQWQRFSFSVTSNASGINQLQFGIVSFTGYGGNNSGQQFDAWGAQVEQKSYPTPYIPTTTSALSRSNTQALLDVSGRNNTITLANMTYGPNNAISFDGTDDYTDVGSWFNYQVFTIDLWVRPGSTQATYADIFDNNHTGTQNFVCQQNVNNTNQYEFGVLGLSGVSGTGLFNLTANTWVNLTFTFDGTRARFFRNGALELSGNTMTGPINYSSPNLRLGGWYYGGGRHWNGQIAKFSTYDRVLSGTEIVNNYNQNKTRFNLQ